MAVKYGRSEDNMFFLYKYIPKSGDFLLFEDIELTEGQCFVCTKRNDDEFSSYGIGSPKFCYDIKASIVTFEEVKLKGESFRYNDFCQMYTCMSNYF